MLISPYIWHLSHWCCSGWGSSWKSTEQYTVLSGASLPCHFIRSASDLEKTVEVHRGVCTLDPPQCRISTGRDPCHRIGEALPETGSQLNLQCCSCPTNPCQQAVDDTPFLSHYMLGQLRHAIHPAIEMTGTKACSSLNIKPHGLFNTPCSKRITPSRDLHQGWLLSRMETVTCMALAAKQMTELQQMGTIAY